MLRQQPDNLVRIDPDLRITFFLAFVKNQLDAEVQVHGFNIIDILPV